MVFLTRHYPPNTNINGESVCDMVEYLAYEYGIKSTVICIEREADGGAGQRTPAGEVIRIGTVYAGKNAFLRFLALFYDGIALLLRARQFPNEWIVVTTSPPLLPMWANLLLRRRQRWVLWAFDLFPEGFQVTRFVGKNNPLYRLALWQTYRKSPNHLIALGERQAAFLQATYGRETPTTILPCGVFFYQDQSSTPPDWYDPAYTWLGYCGNVGDPHNPDFIRAAIDHLDPERQRLVLALYGKHAEALKAYAQGKPGVVLVDRVPRNQLHFIAVHLVSLRREWTHIAVPSKAISAVFMGASVLFCGDRDSDNWAMLQDAAWFIEENEQIEAQIKLFLQNLSPEAIRARREQAPEISQRLKRFVLEGYKVAKAFNDATCFF
jgi:hypothetical protein